MKELTATLDTEYAQSGHPELLQLPDLILDRYDETRESSTAMDKSGSEKLLASLAEVGSVLSNKSSMAR